MELLQGTVSADEAVQPGRSGGMDFFIFYSYNPKHIRTMLFEKLATGEQQRHILRFQTFSAEKADPKARRPDRMR